MMEGIAHWRHSAEMTEMLGTMKEREIWRDIMAIAANC